MQIGKARITSSLPDCSCSFSLSCGTSSTASDFWNTVKLWHDFLQIFLNTEIIAHFKFMLLKTEKAFLLQLNLDIYANKKKKVSEWRHSYASIKMTILILLRSLTCTRNCLHNHSKMRNTLLTGENSHKSITPLLIPQSWATWEPCKTPSNSKCENKTDSCTKNWKTQLSWFQMGQS